ncbi:MAG: ThuA domain-containing protein [Planctomycetes bacterium]|nr:ThuA domain-containing protein [Planctomycetota bacterium]
MVRFLVFWMAAGCCNLGAFGAESIHVLVWDERQPRQEEAYENFLGNEIVAQLKATADDLELRSVALDSPAQGLSAGNLEWADVIVWWGHVRQKEVTAESAKRVVEYIRRGDLDLIALHSAHWASPFVEAMNWRSIEDGRKHLEAHAQGNKLTIETLAPPRQYSVPIHGSVLTPAYFGYKKSRNEFHGLIHLPWCCFPDYRPDGEPSTIAVKSLKHPIASGLPATFQVRQTEMYNEPFHVPEPDEVIFEETWELGERFRSGMVWNIGKGKVFYFRPGHETYPVYKQPELIKVIANACRWLAKE